MKKNLRRFGMIWKRCFIFFMIAAFFLSLAVNALNLPEKGSIIEKIRQRFAKEVPPPDCLLANIDGMGGDDILVFSKGVWLIKLAGETNGSLFSGPTLMLPFGSTTTTREVPVTGDINGDGMSDISLFKRSSSICTWTFRLASGNGNFSVNEINLKFGNSSYDELPLLRDVNGDGLSDALLFRLRGGRWFVKLATGNGNFGETIETKFGNDSYIEIPILADVNGDKMDDLGLWRYNTYSRVFQFRLAAGDGRFREEAKTTQLGNSAYPSEIPLIGDINGDRMADLGILRISGEKQLFSRLAIGGGDFSTDTNEFLIENNEDPVRALIGDINGDKMADLGYFKFRENVWYFNLSTGNGNFASSAISVKM